jgi:glucokinase
VVGRIIMRLNEEKHKKINMIIGVDLGGTKVRAGRVIGGMIEEQREELFNSKASQQDTLQQLIGLIRPLINSSVEGIGLGVPSVVDVEQGIVYNVVNIPSWEKVPLKDILEKEFKLPVSVNNDVNCFVSGEHRFGQIRGLKTAVGITSGTGLGAGIIINHMPFYGNNCGAGEVGLVSYRDHNIEYYASGNFFEVQYQVSAIKAHDLAMAGDRQALGWWNEFGAHMGHAIKTVVYCYDPEAIVVGGSLSKAFRFFSGAMHESLKDFTFPESIKRLKIFQSVNDDIILLGAASLVNNNERYSLKG